MTPACSTPGCKNPSVHRVRVPSAGDWVVGVALGVFPVWKHYCPACYERKVWGKA